MKLKLMVSKDNASLYEGFYEVIDAKSFGDACSDIWVKLVEQKLGAAGSVGAVFELLGDNLAPDLRGVQIKVERAVS